MVQEFLISHKMAPSLGSEFHLNSTNLIVVPTSVRMILAETISSYQKEAVLFAQNNMNAKHIHNK